MDIEISWNGRAGWNAVAPAPYAPLGWYLVQDVQADIRFSEEMLEVCQRISAVGGDWEGTGNAHHVEIARSLVRIENLFVQEGGACELTLDDFRRALEAWLSAIRSRPG